MADHSIHERVSLIDIKSISSAATLTVLIPRPLDAIVLIHGSGLILLANLNAV